MSKLATITASIIVSTIVSSLAFAGKREREYQKTELQPAVAAAEAKYRSACGCALKINVAASIKTLDDLYQAKYTASDIAEDIAGYCTDAESKKAMCAMKTLDIVRGKETGFKFAGGKGTAATDGKTYVNFEQITHELDK